MINPTETTAAMTAAIQQLWQDRGPEKSPVHGGWLEQLQDASLQQFVRTGFPTTRLEDWKYTDIRRLAETYPGWLTNQPVSGSSQQPDLLDIPDAIHLTFTDGIYRPEHSTAKLPEGLLIGPLAELAAQHPAILEAHMGQLASHVDSGFIAINTLCNTAVVALIVPEHTELKQPVYIHHHSSTAETTTQPRLIADLGVNSRASIVEHFSGKCPNISNAVTELHCRDGAQLNYFKLQEDHPEAWHTAAQYIQLDKDAAVNTTILDSGARISRNDLRLCLAGNGATADAKGLLLADGTQHIDSRITVEHAAPNTRSRERYRAILSDRARGVFNGRILVQQAAQKTSAELTNRNLLLSPGAEIDAKPELEIYADDVKCSHGSTTGQLDATSLFYLLSRGIDPLEARNILVRAFASELLSNISIPAIAERVQDSLQALRFTSK